MEANLTILVQCLVTKVDELEARLASLERGKEPAFSLEPEPANAPSRMRVPDEKATASYAIQIGMDSVQHTVWRNHYAANGWKVGRNPMRDWQACMRNWHLTSSKMSPPATIAPQRSPAASQSVPNGAQMVSWGKELEEAQKALAGATPDSHRDASPAERLEILRLKARIRELKALLGWKT